jgi:YD repeat-containing protein
MDPMGKVTYAYYDHLDRLTSVVRKVGSTDDDGGNPDVDAITQAEYDPSDNLTAVVYPEGERVEAGYDQAGRRTSIMAIDPVNGNLSLTLVRDGADNVTSATLPNGNSYSLAYDGANRLTHAGDSVGTVADMTYDADGNVLTRAEALGNTWTFVYDNADRMVERHDPLVETPTDKFAQLVYDGTRLSERVDNKGVRTHYEYDDIDRVLAVVEDYQPSNPTGDTANTTTSYTYDGVGEMLTMTDHDGDTTSYGWDTAGRLAGITYPDNGVVTYTHYDSGKLHTRTDQQNVVTTYTYNDLYQLTARSYSTGRSDTFTWNRSGKLLTANNDVAALTFTYDALRRLTAETQEHPAGEILPAGSYTTTYAYTVGPSGGTRTVGYPGGRVVTETYDLRNRLDSVSGGAGVGADWTFDAANRRTNATLGNGIASLFDFDVNSRLTHIQHARDTTTLFEVSFGYDEIGVKKFARDSTPGRTDHSELYTHDARSRLRTMDRGTLSQDDTTITPLTGSEMPSAQAWPDLDHRGNWPTFTQTVDGTQSTQTRTADAVNAYTSVDLGWGAVSPTYDANGNLTNVLSGYYAYDEENRAVWAAGEWGDVSLYYDALGRRVESYTEDNLDTVRWTRHVYSGLKAVEEYEATIDGGWFSMMRASGQWGSLLSARALGPGGSSSRPGALLALDDPDPIPWGDMVLAREFVWGRTFTEPVAMIDHTDAGDLPAGQPETLHYLTGPLGSVVALTDAAGAVVERYDYDPYGQTYITGPAYARRPIATPSCGPASATTRRRRCTSSGPVPTRQAWAAGSNATRRGMWMG